MTGRGLLVALAAMGGICLGSSCGSTSPRGAEPYAPHASSANSPSLSPLAEETTSAAASSISALSPPVEVAPVPDLAERPSRPRDYVSAVRADNQQDVKATAKGFAAYLTAMHRRIHPIFADTFLAGLDRLESGHPLNDSSLAVTLELVVSPDTGGISNAGVVRPSGVHAFDTAALEAVRQAAPFGEVPAALRSHDGNLYVQWDLHRDPTVSCSTVNARPYLLGR